jgi:hypothetical protein
MSFTLLATHFLRALAVVQRPLGLGLLLLACSATAYAGGPPPPANAPEIDPGSMAAALTFLTGGSLMLADRFRRR